MNDITNLWTTQYVLDLEEKISFFYLLEAFDNWSLPELEEIYFILFLSHSKILYVHWQEFEIYKSDKWILAELNQ